MRFFFILMSVPLFAQQKFEVYFDSDKDVPNEVSVIKVHLYRFAQ